jgi:Ca2+-binding RTX toxin-like protein
LDQCLSRLAQILGLTAVEGSTKLRPVTGSRLRLLLSLAVLAGLMLLGLPSASAHEQFTIKDGLLTVIGSIEKPNDLVTVTYDSSQDEFVIGHDIIDPIPDGCHRDAVEPFHKVHCPASQISEILIQTSGGSDKIEIIPDGVLFPANVTVEAGSGNDSFQGGPEVDSAKMGGGSDKAMLGAGNDFAAMGGGSDKVYGGPGDDTLKGGGAPDKLYGGGGDDQCKPGGGVGKEFSC